MQKEDPKLSSVHKRAIQACYEDITESLDVDSIMDLCYSKGILTKPMKDDIMAMPTPAKKCRAFLDKLDSCTVDEFNEFLNVLKEKNYEYLADSIEQVLLEKTFINAEYYISLANKMSAKDSAHAKESAKRLIPIFKKLMSTNQLEINEVQTPLVLSSGIAPLKASSVDSTRMPSIHLVDQPESSKFLSRSMSTDLSNRRQAPHFTIVHETPNPRFRLIFSICFFKNGSQVQIVIDEDGDTKAILCDVQSQVIDVLVVSSCVWHAICNNQDIAAISCKPESVPMVKLFNSSGSHLKNIVLHQIEIPSRLGFFSDHQLLIADNKAKVLHIVDIQSDGSSNQNFGHGRVGDFESIEDIAVDSGKNHVFVADSQGRSVKSYDISGNLLFEYTGSDINSGINPKSLCVDSNGCVIIADNISNHIELLDQEGVFVKNIISKEPDIHSPIAVTFDRKGGLVVVTNVIGQPGIYIVTPEQ
ncbi:unnamed protein product [Owenia fusiformis]|uniref:Uncharacterized protein n=1 Tax=Owenia fusiformis TaxID=6347 RepID=A0A8J1URQ6_OWEFU|nr:unnamed protein product [Owenia fusiformis]